MKYIVFLGDGMADTPVEALQGKTPLMVAKKPNVDALAPYSEIGLARTVPEGMKPGSDTANLAVMGYDPRSCYSGRSPLEALSMGLTLSDTDIAVRCNLVTLSAEEENYADKRMIDYSAGEISTEESRELIEFIQSKLGDDRVSFHPGISYRHCLIVHDATVGSDLTPPHDITGKPIKRHLPSGVLGELFLDLQMKSYDLLKDHPVNQKRIAEGKNPANSIWFWGEGTKPALPDFYEKNGIKGAVISAVDLLKGIGKGAGMEVIEVPGATGNVHTDFAAKGKAAIDAFARGFDYVYIHVEAPDESGHQGSLEDKITSIEKIDSDIVGPVLEYLKNSGEPYHVLVCPDHPTPLAIRTHSADPIPYLIYKSDDEKQSGVTRYDEENAKESGIFVEEGFTLIDRLLSSEPAPKEEGINPTFITSADGSEEIRFSDGSEGDSTQESPVQDTENVSDDRESAESPTEDEKPKKEKKKRNFGAFFKKHLLLFIILIAVVLIAGGLTAGHFIATYHVSFIRSEEDLTKALAKKQVTTLVLKKNVTVSGDLTLKKTVDLDLNEYKLTVKGDLTMPLEKDASIGYKKSGKYQCGGKIVAASFTATGTKNLYFYADLETEKATITATKLKVKGNFKGENATFTLQAAEITFCGNAQGAIDLSNEAKLTMNGNADSIKGGSTVTLKSGAVDTVKDADVLYLYEKAAVKKIVNVENFYRVTRLSAPAKITVLPENGDYKCYVSEVIGATHITYSLNGKEKVKVAVGEGATVFTLSSSDLTPGKQTLVIQAIAEDDPCYLDSPEKTYKFEFSAKLDTPTLSVKQQGDTFRLTIAKVKHADQYRYTVDGKAQTVKAEDGEVEVELTSEGGVHVVEVTAQSNNKYFSDSNAAMTGYVVYLTLEKPTVSVQKQEEEVTFAWEKITGATSYLVTYGEDKIYTTELSLVLPYATDASFTIKAIGGGYYRDGANTLLTAQDILEGTAEEVEEEIED